MTLHHSTAARLAAVLLLLAFGLLASTSVVAEGCPTLLPAHAVAVSHPTLCQSHLMGDNTLYSCQDYRSPQGRFRVLFKGGQVPRAVVHIDAQGSEHLVWTRKTAGELPACSLVPPDALPAEAIHRGTGVCYDDDERAVPCSMFEHAMPRQEDFFRYLVYYFPDRPTEPVIEKFHAGRNENAIVAEFAYQMGLSLLNTHCCSEQAIGYLEYAYRLFPRADLYSSAYKEARFLLSSRAHPTDFALYLD